MKTNQLSKWEDISKNPQEGNSDNETIANEVDLVKV